MKLFDFSNIIFGLIFSLASCKPKTKSKVEFKNPSIDTVTNITSISMKDLVKTFSSLQGQYIETEGIVYFEFENVAICLDKAKDSKCFWLDLSRDLIINDS